MSEKRGLELAAEKIDEGIEKIGMTKPIEEYENLDKSNEEKGLNYSEMTPINMMQLLIMVSNAEYEYKTLKLTLEQKFNSELISIDWNEINEERKKLELPKLGNQDMKEAFIKDSLREEYSKLSKLELDYYHIKRTYDVALKYSIDVLR